MRAFVFSIGEQTTELCCDLLNGYGFDVVLFQDHTSLAEKLTRFYKEGLETEDEACLRIDADIIPNRNVNRLVDIQYAFGKSSPSWVCASGFDWYKQDRGAISIHVMNREALKRAYKHSLNAGEYIRPETYIWRQPDINAFTLIVESFNSGLHGYGQENQRDRIKTLKHARNQAYDWSLVERLEALHV